jgi:hypothetical protein
MRNYIRVTYAFYREIADFLPCVYPGRGHGPVTSERRQADLLTAAPIQYQRVKVLKSQGSWKRLRNVEVLVPEPRG